MKTYRIFDINLEEDSDPIEDPLVLETSDIEKIRDFTLQMLIDFFEVYSKYGDPVEGIFKYVENDKLLNILRDYNYRVEVVQKGENHEIKNISDKLHA